MNEKSRERVPKPDWNKIPEKITKSQQLAIAKAYDRRLLKGERSEDILADLSSKYERDVRTIQRHIRKGREILASNKQGRPNAEQSAMVTQVNPRIIEAEKKHFEDLCTLICRWQGELGFKPEPSRRHFASIFSVRFKPEDTKSGKHELQYNTLTWEVDDKGAIEVRFPVEEDVLFKCLRYHIPDALWRKFEQLKQELADSISQAKSIQTGTYTYAENADRIAGEIYDELELVLAKHGGLPGKCPACPEC